MKKAFYYVILLFIVIASDGCRKAYDEIDIGGDFSPELVAPLVGKQVRLEDLLKGLGADVYLEARPDGLFQMQYNGKFSKERTINVVSTFQNPIITPIKDRITLQQFQLPTGMAIDSTILKKGSFKWTMKNDNSSDMEVRLYIYELTKNGQNFIQNFTIKARQTFTGNLDLEGWALNLNNVGAVYIFYDAFVNGVQGYAITGTYEFSGLESKKTIGYFGTDTLKLEKSSLNLDFFQKWIQKGEVQFFDPTVKITVENGLGMPLDIVTKIAEGKKKDGTKIPILNATLENGFPANYPNFNEIGSSKQTSVTLTSANSNIAAVINSYPSTLDFEFVANPNPNSTTKRVGHVVDNASVKMKMDATIPMVVNAKNFTVIDTIPIDFTKFKEVQTAEFKISTDNSLPVDITLQAYFVSSSGQILDSLVQTGESFFIKSAQTNASGQVSRSTSNTTFIKVPADRMNKLRPAKSLHVNFQLSTNKNATGPVRLTLDQKVIMNIGVKTLTKL